jgi:hypothetical protein
MPQDNRPIEQRSTEELMRRFDFITRNSRVVREAIECVFIMQELGRREAIAEVLRQQREQTMRKTLANEGAIVGGFSGAPDDEPQQQP